MNKGNSEEVVPCYMVPRKLWVLETPSPGFVFLSALVLDFQIKCIRVSVSYCDKRDKYSILSSLHPKQGIGGLVLLSLSFASWSSSLPPSTSLKDKVFLEWPRCLLCCGLILYGGFFLQIVLNPFLRSFLYVNEFDLFLFSPLA